MAQALVAHASAPGLARASTSAPSARPVAAKPLRRARSLAVRGAALADAPQQQKFVRPDASGRFGRFGGKYVPETLIPALAELEVAYKAAQEDPSFQVGRRTISGGPPGGRQPAHSGRLGRRGPWPRPRGRGPRRRGGARRGRRRAPAGAAGARAQARPRAQRGHAPCPLAARRCRRPAARPAPRRPS
jgi:hypothetical protein